MEPMSCHYYSLLLGSPIPSSPADVIYEVSLSKKHLVAYFLDVRERIISEEAVVEAAEAEFETVKAECTRYDL